MVNATTGAALTGATVTAYRALDNGSQAAATGTTTELANGQYRFNLSQADTNAENGSYLFVATSAVPVEKTVVFTSANPSDATAFGLSQLDAAISSRMASYTQPTGFLAATFPATVSSYAGGAVASVTAGVTVTTNNDKTGYTVSTVSDKTGYSLTAGTGLGNQTANITGNLSGSVGSVTGAVGSVTSGVTVTTNNDKTGYSLASGGLAAVTTWTVGITGNITGNLSGSVGSVTAGVTLDSAERNTLVDLVWDEAMSGHTTSGTYGGRIVRATNSNTEVQITGSNHIAADVHEFQAGVITASDFAANSITASALATDAVAEIQSGLATSAALAAAKTILDKVDTGLVVDGAVYQFTANMLELAPAGGGGGGGSGDATLAKQEEILTQLDVIQTKTDTIGSVGAITSLLAAAVLEPGTITSFPETLTIGDSYTEQNGREIQIPIVDTNGTPLSSTGSLNFADASVTFTLQRSGETDSTRVITGTATFVDPPGTGTGAGAPYAVIELPASETAKGLKKYKYSGILTFLWTGTGTDVMSFETGTVTFDS